MCISTSVVYQTQLSGSCRSIQAHFIVKIYGKLVFSECNKSEDLNGLTADAAALVQCIKAASLRPSTAMPVILKPPLYRIMQSHMTNTGNKTPKFLSLAKKQGFNMLESTAHWTWINTTGALFYIQCLLRHWMLPHGTEVGSQ